ncbi:MAG: hypothetical protein IPP22_13370 [Nitrosomonas sp.]|nr:hypothetical protein [Nitrosomonas sp.]
MFITRRLCIFLIFCLLTACVNLPTGPSVMTLPGSGKSFDQFRYDDYECREYAYQQIGGKTPQQSSRTSGVESAAIGAGLGAISGVAIGGGEGAAIGSGVGLLVGALMGLSSGTSSGYESQQRYDMGYIQCMYAKGHRVPVSGNISSDQPANSGVNPRISTPPAKFTPPPPPSGNPPLPPPQ